MILNSVILARRNAAFDPYPYILLNLFLSMTAALQAPVIMMSQQRQAVKDRLDAAHDYEINLKAELEIAALHEKMDELREKQWGALVEQQQEQIRLLTQLAEGKIRAGRRRRSRGGRSVAVAARQGGANREPPPGRGGVCSRVVGV